MLDFLNRLFELMSPVWAVSLAGAWAAAVVFLLRLALKDRVPRQVMCLLWLVVFVRLALPFSFQSPVSLVPAPVAEDIPARVEQFAGRLDPAPQTGQTGLTPDQLVRPGATHPQTQTGVTAPAVPAPRTFPLRAALAGAWLAGTAAMLGYALFSYLRLKRRLFDAIKNKFNAWEHPYVGSTFILGMLRPRIYVPVGISGDTRRFILCHERAHLERGDHIVKPLCWLVLAVHWFNPAAWLSFLLLSRDMEAACDEAVLRRLGERVKTGYSSTLLSLATEGRFPAPSPLAFDEGDAKSRIRNVLRYHRPAVAAVVIGVVAVVVAAACLLTSPVRADETEGGDTPETIAPSTELEPADTTVTALDSGEDGLYHQFRLTHGGRSVTFSGSAESGWGPDDVAEIATAALGDSASGGQKQVLAVVFRTSHGTGVLAEELHLFDPDTLDEYDCSGVVDSALGRLGSYSDDENYYITVSGDALAAVSRAEWPGFLSYLFFGDYYGFETRDGQLYLVIAAGCFNGPTYCGEVWVRLGLDGRRAVCLDYSYAPARDEPTPEGDPKGYLLTLLDRGFANGGWQGWYFILPATGPMIDPALEAEPLKALFSSLEWTYQGTEDDIGTLSNYSLRWENGDSRVRLDFSEEDALLSVTVRDGSTPTRLLFRAEGTDDLSASFLALCPDPWLDFGRVTVPFGEDAGATARRFLREALALYQREGNATEFEAEAGNIREQEGGGILYEASIALKPADPDRAFWRGKLDGNGWYRQTFTVFLEADPDGGDCYVLGYLEPLPQNA